MTALKSASPKRAVSGASKTSLTARPTHISERESSGEESHESGLSVEPEDLGSQFLSFAVEQGNSEWPSEFSEDDFGGDEGAVLADALDLEADESVLRSWERAMLRQLAGDESFGARENQRALERSRRRFRMRRDLSEGARTGVELAEKQEHARDAVDLTDPSTQEVSLFDREGRELGDVLIPSVWKTDDSRMRGKPRGGHLPRERSARPSLRAQRGKTLR